MRFVLGFAPFLVFAVVDRMVGPIAGLTAGALVSAVLVARDVVVARRSPKILEIGTTLLLGALALYSALAAPHWTIVGVRLCVDGGLLVIVLVTMAIGRPFTLQYAREQVGAAQQVSPSFLRTNYVITGVWALAFAAMVVVEAVLVARPDLPSSLGSLAIAAAIGGAFMFTRRYPQHLRSRSAAEENARSAGTASQM